MKPVRTLIVVADGERARFLLHEGIGHGLTPAMDQEMHHELPRTREIGSERPGRAATPIGTKGRHVYENTVDYHEFEKARFAHEVAAFLDKMRLQDRFDRLVLVAPPKTLGSLRESLSKAARAMVTGELDKDLTQKDVKDLEGALGQVMAV